MSPEASLPYTGEVARKALHLLALTIPLGMWWIGMPGALYVLTPLALLGVAADAARAYSKWFNRFIRAVFGPLMRRDELPDVQTGIQFNGATCVLVGATFLVFLFPVRMAAPVLAMAMVADAAAALVGRRLGRHSWGALSTTVEGSAAFVITGLAIMAFVPTLAFGPAAAGVLGGAVAEALPFRINDNIRVPLVAAFLVAGGEAVFLGRPFPLFAGFPT